MDQHNIITDEHILCTEYNDYNEWTKQTNSESLNILSLNIRSLTKNWEEFKLITNDSKENVDIIILTETNIKDLYKHLYF